MLIAVDDRQWLDASSRHALDYAVRRLDGAPVGILTAQRPDASDSTETETIRLRGLSVAALFRLIESRLGVSLSRSTILRVHRTTNGKSFYALEIASALIAAELPGASDPWPIPDNLRDIVATRVRRLSKTSRGALLIAAASSRKRLDANATTLRSAQRAGIVRIDEDGSAYFAHPLYAAAIYEGATDEERRHTHATLAEEEDELEEKARHRALATSGADEQVAGLLERAAMRALARGATDVAAELGERAVHLTPSEMPETDRRRRVAAAEYNFRAGDLERARTQLRELVRRTDAPPDSHTLRLLAEVCYRLRHLDEAIQHLHEAIAAADGEPAATARAELDLTYALSYSFRSFQAADAAAQRAVSAAEQTNDGTLLAGALAESASMGLILGRGLDEERLGRALRLEDPEEPGPIERRPSVLAAEVLFYVGEVDRPRDLLTALVTRLTERGEDSALPYVLALLAQVECTSGNLAKARELSVQSYDAARQEGSDSLAATARAVQAIVDAQAGRIEEARAAAAEATRLAVRSDWGIAAFLASTALGHLELALGNHAAVAAILGRSIALVEQDGVVEPFRRPFLPDAIEALSYLGETDRAERLASELVQVGRALGRPWATLTGARCQAIVRGVRGETAFALSELSQALAAEPEPTIPLELARTLIVKGQLERRAKKRSAAVRTLQRALALCEEMGAELWAARAHSELARVGSRRNQSELSPTESRVAVLAASGLTNREIAAAAFMSQKTVEANLCADLSETGSPLARRARRQARNPSG